MIAFKKSKSIFFQIIHLFTQSCVNHVAMFVRFYYRKGFNFPIVIEANKNDFECAADLTPVDCYNLSLFKEVVKFEKDSIMQLELLSTVNEVGRIVNNINGLKVELDKEMNNLSYAQSQLYKKLMPLLVIDKDLKFKSELPKRSITKYIFFHHRAGVGSVESLHEYHLSLGWEGIGYNLYIDLNGNIYQGRPHDAIGAHCLGWNNYSIGICFEGDYTKIKKMPMPQFSAGIKAVRLLRDIKPEYNNLPILGHNEKYKTECPGNKFPVLQFKSILNVFD